MSDTLESVDSTSSLIHARGLTKRFGELTAVDAIDFDVAAGESFEVGPFRVDTWPLPHYLPNAGLRLAAGGRVLAYTGDTGPSPAIVELARAADLLLAEASFPEQVPASAARYLSSARQAGEAAAAAGAGRLLLTHLLPGSVPEEAEEAARRAYHGELGVARAGAVVDLG